MRPARGAILQRKCACGSSSISGGQCEECKKKRKQPEQGQLQRSATSNDSPQTASQTGPQLAPAIVHDVLRSPGQPLDVPTRAFFEPRFGHDFSKVRIHADSKASESARAVNANAYTSGSNIVFAKPPSGTRDPGGMSLMAHELTHVVQQSAASPGSGALQVGAPDTPHEREADRMAQAVVHRQSAAPPTAQGTALLQRDAQQGGNGITQPLTCAEMCGDGTCQAQIGEQQCTTAQEATANKSWIKAGSMIGPAIKNFEDGYLPPMNAQAVTRLQLALKKNFNWSRGDSPTNLPDIVYGKLNEAFRKISDFRCNHCNNNCPDKVGSFVIFDRQRKPCLVGANCFGICQSFNDANGPHALLHELFHRVVPPPAPGAHEDYLNRAPYQGTAERASIQADTYASLVDDLSPAAATAPPPSPGPAPSPAPAPSR